jgi:hypothetical protein
MEILAIEKRTSLEESAACRINPPTVDLAMVCLWVYRQTVRAGNTEHPFIAIHIAVTVAFQPPFDDLKPGYLIHQGCNFQRQGRQRLHHSTGIGCGLVRRVTHRRPLGLFVSPIGLTHLPAQEELTCHLHQAPCRYSNLGSKDKGCELVPPATRVV